MYNSLVFVLNFIIIYYHNYHYYQNYWTQGACSKFIDTGHGPKRSTSGHRHKQEKTYNSNISVQQCSTFPDCSYCMATHDNYDIVESISQSPELQHSPRGVPEHLNRVKPEDTALQGSTTLLHQDFFMSGGKFGN